MEIRTCTPGILLYDLNFTRPYSVILTVNGILHTHLATTKCCSEGDTRPRAWKCRQNAIASSLHLDLLLPCYYDATMRGPMMTCAALALEHW